MLNPSTLIEYIQNPMQKIELIRNGVQPEVIENYLNPRSYIIGDILERLHIPKSTYLLKKKNKQALDACASEKLVRLVEIINMAEDLLGESGAKDWLYRSISALGNYLPVDLLDTAPGYNLVEETLLQIKYGLYN